MIDQIVYATAERAAVWMERGDDHMEAAAIRELIKDHKALVSKLEAITSIIKFQPDNIIGSGQSDKV